VGEDTIVGASRVALVSSAMRGLTGDVAELCEELPGLARGGCIHMSLFQKGLIAIRSVTTYVRTRRHQI
jgi:hypothetical protein